MKINLSFAECQLYARKKVYVLKVLTVRPFHNQCRGWQTFSLKGQRANNLDFTGHNTISSQLCNSLVVLPVVA